VEKFGSDLGVYSGIRNVGNKEGRTKAGGVASQAGDEKNERDWKHDKG
jgi:hypothetical protein